MLVCPITTKAKGYPFEAPLGPGLRVTGVVLVDQIKSLDWRARKAEFIDRAPVSVIEEVLSLIMSLVREEA